MTFDEAMRKIAHRAAEGSRIAMEKLSKGRIKHEDDLTGSLAQAIEDQVNGVQTGGVKWDYSVLTHRRSGEEGVYGADLLIHVGLKTENYSYSKGVLVQSKRTGPSQKLDSDDFAELKGQCNKMIRYSPSSFVFSYDPQGLRVAAATKISGSNDRDLYDQSDWTAYRFFLEVFRCPIGDPRISSANVDDLRPRYAFSIEGQGRLDRAE
jgi:hypothetical protein